jgi:glycosyltransferase involved in cell wall biosynthesis
MLSQRKLPIRILHVVGSMNRGGLETWLMHILRHIDCNIFQMDFLVHTTQECPYDQEIRALGSKIIPCIDPSKPWLYARNFRRIMQEYGPYEIIHSHVHHFSGYVLYLAQKAAIPVRIAHSHIDSSPLEANSGLPRRLYLSLMQGMIDRYATVGLGCSNVASADLFGKNWEKDRRWQILYYGIDMTPFEKPVDTLQIRSEFGIKDNAFVIGHVGRFMEQKNHQFLIKIFLEVLKQESKSYLLLIGDGPLQSNIKDQAVKMGLSDRVIFTGTRSDIPKLMMSAMDVFVLPSLSEGLPVVGIESQCAGLPSIISSVITDELDKVKPLVQKIDLSQPAEKWADAILAAKNTKSTTSQSQILSILKNSEFNIVHSVKAIEKIYANSHL